ncbi:hypothetical protein Val02_17430 [Virgisporangium aliadipatigenens]|uniref:Diguanylate cyclase/phosphodiesterase n=1 Tax=Virgisporangium aliadipatigenens TaxID=741659 RepID=A0A8J3YIC9_9ACTN|nr:bifunctional diguanylate cyclase/phosphodiesterase [Virgisporangium aliadipatigenens]GIJ44857.1 hypothetical protein Val02_17430 [Virgisporangium aliadipatigenens]
MTAVPVNGSNVGATRASGPGALVRRIGLRVLALGVVAIGLLHAGGRLDGVLPGTPAPDVHPSLAAVAAVMLITFCAQILQVRIRTGRGEVGFAWGEAAVVIALFFLPTGLLPLVVLVGVLTARLAQFAGHKYVPALRTIGTFRVRTTVYQALSNTAALTVAAGVGATVAVSLGLRSHPALTPRVAAVLTVSALLYCCCSLTLVAAQLSARGVQRFRPLIWELAWSKAPIAVGNVVIGVAALAILSVDANWLLALPPVLWLLHLTHSYRLRTDDERRTWQVFAQTTRELNHLDEEQAAAAGLRGAQSLFAAERAEIAIDGLPGGLRTFDIDKDGVVGRNGTVTPARAAAAIRPLLVGGAPVGELRLYEGTQVGERSALMLAAYGDALAAVLHDAATHAELRALSERRTFDAEYDGVTGLANRAALLTRGAAALGGLDAAAPVALLLLDINHFKEVNTTLGHAAGDDVLRAVGERLSAARVQDELIARLGGDEFALLLTGAGATLPAALAHARHLAGQLAQPTAVAGVQLSVEASIGVVAATAGAVDMTELLRRADIAMYQAKRGGSSVDWYDPDRDDASTDRLALLAELREALAGEGQFDLLLQPLVRLKGGRPTGVEAFVRWNHPRRGTLKPVDFVRVVEQSELLGQFTRHTIDRALDVCGQLAAQGTPLAVGVNLSPRSLHDRDLPADIARMLARHGLPAYRLILEITETVVLSEDAVVDDVLRALRDQGIQIAVDDFGTGFSALTFLTRVPVDVLKIDRTFVNRMVDSPEALAIVRTTVELGRELGIQVSAEGVETAEQRRVLEKLSCPAGQGFHFCPPVSTERLLEVVRTTPGEPMRRLRAAE